MADRYQYQENGLYFAQTQRLLEPVALEELTELGASHCKEGYCGVYFKAAPALLYKIIYCARTVTRVLAPLIRFPCRSEDALYRTALNVPWHDFFILDKTFAVQANVSDSSLKHSRFAGLRLKDAIADRFRREYGKRPDVDPKEPDILFNLNIRENQAVISVDLSGGSLHRRGYRTASVIAPMQETLAAAILRLSEWHGQKPLIDPMCGSGTILAEALMKYCQIPAGIMRHNFGFFHLPDFEPQTWQRVKQDCDEKIRPCPPGLIKGFDIDRQAIKAAQKNLKRLPGGLQIPLQQSKFQDLTKIEDHYIITNPPYGIRMSPGERDELQLLYKQLGDLLKQQCKGSVAYILCGDPQLTKHIGLKITRRIPIYNGPIEARLVKIEIF